MKKVSYNPPIVSNSFCCSIPNSRSIHLDFPLPSTHLDTVQTLYLALEGPP